MPYAIFDSGKKIALSKIRLSQMFGLCIVPIFILLGQFFGYYHPKIEVTKKNRPKVVSSTDGIV